MKIHRQAIALMRFVDQEGGEASVSSVAEALGRRTESLRHQFDNYAANGFMTIEPGYPRGGNEGRGRPTTRIFKLTPAAMQLLAANPHIPAAKAKQAPQRPLINSVFSLGSSAA